MNSIVFRTIPAEKRPRLVSGFVKDDGGRESTGFSEYRDCTVRALVHVSGVPYPQVHKLCADWGRKPRKGFINFHLAAPRMAADLGIELTTVEAPGTLGKLIAKHPTKTLLVRVSGHAFAVKASIVRDLWPQSALRRVKNAWIVSSKSVA
jgi:hypothetical protein